MSTSSPKAFKPEGHQTIVPYLSVSDGKKQIDFLKATFNAKELERMETPNGGLHAELKVYDMVVMIGQVPPDSEWKPTSASLYIYVEDTDKIYAAAIKAGATSLREPSAQSYGDRNAGVLDPNGNQWWLATHVGKHS